MLPQLKYQEWKLIWKHYEVFFLLNYTIEFLSSFEHFKTKKSPIQPTKVWLGNLCSSNTNHWIVLRQEKIFLIVDICFNC